MHPHQELLHRFYQAFQRRDHAGMAACYHPEATFEDAAFQLKGAEIGQMWRMLCERGRDLRLAYNDVAADEHAGRATWDARYTFSQTRRKVHNHIQAHLPGRPHPHPPRRVQLLALVAAGAGADGLAAGLVGVSAEQGARHRPPGPGAVYGPPETVR